MLNLVQVSLSVPADNDRGPQYMEQALATIHQANTKRLPIEFGFGVHRGTVALRCRFPTELAATVTSQLAAHYPAATVERVTEDPAKPPESREWSIELRLHPDLFPIRRYAQFDDPLNRNVSDPLTGIFRLTSCASRVAIGGGSSASICAVTPASEAANLKAGLAKNSGKRSEAERMGTSRAWAKRTDDDTACLTAESLHNGEQPPGHTTEGR